VKQSVLLFIAAAAVIGCVPLRQDRVITGPADVDMHIDVDQKYVLVQVGPPNVAKGHRIIAEKSHVRVPSGDTYGITVEPHVFDVEREHTHVRDRVVPRNADGSRLEQWPNGVWSIHLTLQTNGGFRVVDQQLKVGTFYYSPLVHGRPN
jgi:hypothetical protein